MVIQHMAARSRLVISGCLQSTIAYKNTFAPFHVCLRPLTYSSRHSWPQFRAAFEVSGVSAAPAASSDDPSSENLAPGTAKSKPFDQSIQHELKQAKKVVTRVTRASKEQREAQNMTVKRANKEPHEGRKSKIQKRKDSTDTLLAGVSWKEGSNDDVIEIEVRQLLASIAIETGVPEEQGDAAPDELELTVVKTSSTGDGIALDPHRKHAYVIPFAIEGDTVRAHPFFTSKQHHYSRADLRKVVAPSPLRDDSRVRCRYFASCGGCHFQMMLPEDQLVHKRRIVQDAFTNFSNIEPSLLPEVEATLPSPLQYDYRTKLTPHFDGPPGFQRRRKPGQPRPSFTEVPPIGFNIKNRRKILDIEECPIGSKAVQHGLKQERINVANKLNTYSKGATILLRETTKREEKQPDMSLSSFEQPVVSETDSYFETKDYVTSSNEFVQEYVGDSLFVNNANSFFQNNNSILPSFIAYIKERLFSKVEGHIRPKYLVDAYCGSGLFTVTLASQFETSIGVDIDPNSIKFAILNATRNDLTPERASFKTANAWEIFREITFPPSETVMVIDPPRKGCDVPFLKQLLQYGPDTIVYVSCNVHTQARDVGFMVNGIHASSEHGSAIEARYDVESLRGCDFFPQTSHVEGVAILRKRSTRRSTSPE